MKPNTKIPCVFMRGGTSKALFFHEKDLPEDESLRDKIILSALGSPDVRQIDGMGGGTTTTSKVAIIKKSSREGVDIDYTFRQVSPESSIVGKTMNCGNISSAVGPFAIDEGLVEAVEPVTSVRVFNTNTNKLMVLHVAVGNGRALTEGNFEIDGVPGTGAKIQIEFSNPQGAVSGRLLPTGSPLDTIVIDGKTYEYSLLDVGNPTVFVRAEQFGLSGLELPAEFEALLEIYSRYPVAELTIHPRVRQDFYKGRVREDAFAAALPHCPMPVCYNGDLVSERGIRETIERYPALSALMLGRGLLGDPSLVTRVRGGESADSARLQAFHDTLFARYCDAFGDSRIAVLRMKELWFYFGNLFENSEKLQKSIKKAKNAEEFERAAAALFCSCEVRGNVVPAWFRPA